MTRWHQRLCPSGLPMRLALISVVSLFLEIALIRWISTEIRIFAYVNNLVLLACFLGIGLGCYTADRRASLTMTLVTLVLLLAAVHAPIQVSIAGTPVHPFRDTPVMLSVFSETLIWFREPPTHLFLKVLVGLASTCLIFGMLVIIFIPLGRLLGGWLRDHPHPVAAYSVNIAASLVGIWLFNGLSFLFLPPWVWFAVAGLLLWPFRQRSAPQAVAWGGLAFMLTAMAVSPHLAKRHIVWSPYQKLEVIPVRRAAAYEAQTVKVNNVGYMNLLDLSRRGLETLPIHLDPRQAAFSQYDLPYRFLERVPEEVLIVGAGGGNDAAGALRHFARRITAVEIDPGVYRIGRTRHPERPYDDPRVTVVIDDARAFLRRSRSRYDVISFGLLDAHTQASTYNNTRLDHYVYTVESFQEARERLKEDGVLTVVFESKQPFITDRMAKLLRGAFGQEPLVFNVWSDGWFGPGGIMFVVSRDMARLQRALDSRPALRQFVERRQQVSRPSFRPPSPDALPLDGEEGEARVLLRSRADKATAKQNTASERFRPTGKPVGLHLTTDDWPYLYVERPRIPILHLCLSGILLFALFVLRRLVIPRGKTLDRHFLFLGAAFLLLEFQNISKTTLLFGSTWLVTTVTLSAILALILLANWAAGRAPHVGTPWLYGCLFVSLVCLFLIPLRIFNVLPPVARGVSASLVLNLPIVFAGMIFIRSFRRAHDRSLAFGSNLLGAVVGGLLESLSFVTGIQALLVGVTALYFFSFLALKPRTA